MLFIPLVTKEENIQSTAAIKPPISERRYVFANRYIPTKVMPQYNKIVRFNANAIGKKEKKSVESEKSD